MKNVYQAIAGRKPEDDIRKNDWVAVLYDSSVDLLQVGGIGMTALNYNGPVMVAKQGVPSVRIWENGMVSLNKLIDTSQMLPQNKAFLGEDVVKKYAHAYWADKLPGRVVRIDKWEWQYALRNR